MIAVQAAMALSEDQMDQACDVYDRLLASLRRLTAEQGAVLSAWPQQPGAVYIFTRVRGFSQRGRSFVYAVALPKMSMQAG